MKNWNELNRDQKLAISQETRHAADVINQLAGDHTELNRFHAADLLDDVLAHGVTIDAIRHAVAGRIAEIPDAWDRRIDRTVYAWAATEYVDRDGNTWGLSVLSHSIYLNAFARAVMAYVPTEPDQKTDAAPATEPDQKAATTTEPATETITTTATATATATIDRPTEPDQKAVTAGPIKRHDATEKALAAFDRNAIRAAERAELIDDAKLIKRGVVVSIENAKMNDVDGATAAELAFYDAHRPIYLTVSLPVGTTCAACMHYRDCYAKRGRQATTAVQTSYYYNLEYYKRFGVASTVAAIVRAMRIQSAVARVDGLNPAGLRFFAAGDLPDVDFYGVIVGVADAIRGTDIEMPVFGFTRRFDLRAAGIAKYGQRDDVNLIMSYNGYDVPDELNPDRGMKERVIYSAADVEPEMFICPGNCATCGAHTVDGVAYCAIRRAGPVGHIAH